MRLKKKYAFIYLLILFCGCAVENKIIEKPFRYEKKDAQIPAGVDSAVAYNSRIKAGRLFVAAKREQLADSLNNHFSDYLKITVELHEKLLQRKEELEKTRQSFLEMNKSWDDKIPLSLEDRRKYDKLIEAISEDSLTFSIVTSLLDYYLNYCHENFQHAYESNPFDLKGLLNLARCDWERGYIFSDSLAYQHAILSLQKILNYDRGVAFFYREIGKIFLQLQKWQQAYEYLSKAKEIYLLTAIFDNPSVTLVDKYKKLNLAVHVKPEDYYDCIFNKGKAELKIYAADSALASLEVALTLAPTKRDSNNIIGLINDKIKWDDGNIYAADQKEIIMDSLYSGKYEWAKNAYLRLIPQLKTKKARDNIIWELAKVEYGFLNQKEEAANRLYNLVIHADTSETTGDIYRAPDDSLYKEYFNDCGKALFGLGSMYKNQGLFPKARQFFVQDTTFEWSEREKIFLYLASLVVYELPEDITAAERFKLANEKTIKLLNRAREFVDKLNTKEIDLLYQPLIRIYRQQKDLAKANYFNMEYRQKKAQLRNKP